MKFRWSINIDTHTCYHSILFYMHLADAYVEMDVYLFLNFFVQNSYFANLPTRGEAKVDSTSYAFNPSLGTR